jgi:hypothetical protein
MSILTNIKKRGLKDIFSLRVVSYLESIWQKIFGVRILQKDMVAYSEQVVYKAFRCPECKAKGECVFCGCNFKDLSVSKDAVCSEGRWGKTMNEKDWEKYKSTYLPGTEFGIVKKKILINDGQ